MIKTISAIPSISSTGVTYSYPYGLLAQDGNVIPFGICMANSNLLDCYDWENEDMLYIYGLIEADENNIPENQYYVHNIDKDSDAWVLDCQVSFNYKWLDGGISKFIKPNIVDYNLVSLESMFKSESK